MPKTHLVKKLSSQALITLLLGFAGTAILFVAINYLEYSRVSYDFERRAANRISAVENGLQDAADDLTMVNRLFSTAGIVSYDQFRSFVTPLLTNHPHILNFTFQRLISAAERPAFESRMRAIYPHFMITEVADGKLIAAGSREQYRVVEYVVPAQGNESVLGLDALARQQQAAAALRACQSGQPSITRPYVLVHRNLTMRGMVMLAPVYRPGANLDNAVLRCQAIVGYVAAVFDAQKLVEQILKKRNLLGHEGYAVTVYAANSRNADDLVFRSEDTKYSVAPPYSVLRKIFSQRPGDISSGVEVAGRQWQVVVSSLPLPLVKSHLASLLTLMAGVLATVLAAAYMQSSVMHGRRVRQLIEERAEKSLREQALHNANRQLEEERTHLRSLFDQAPGFIAVLAGPQHVFEIANSAYYDVVGHRDLIGKTVREALPEIKDQGFYELLDQVYATGEPYVGKGIPIRIQQEESYAIARYVDFVYQPMMGADGKVTAIFVQGNDVSLQTLAQRQIEHLNRHDSLTGLANGELVWVRLQQMIVQAEKDGSSIVVMMIDIDRFKSANENFGHTAANDVLKIIAERLPSVTQGSGVVGRLGGDKFLLVLPGQFEDSAYSATIQRIRDAIGAKINIEGHELFLTCCIGIATYPVDATTPDTVIQYADIAMYGAKELGHNSFQFYTPKRNERVRERLKIEAAMRNALERSEFVLHYQPQLDLRTGRVIAVEALIRWQHPELGMLSPGAFIGIAEDTGLIVPIGEWVLRAACAQMKAWQDAGLGNLRVAVNLSARQFAQGDLADFICQTLEQSGLSAQYLDLELTESLVMSDVEEAIGVLKKLSELRVQLSIDDFGTGYSSLAYLKRFPIDVLKIDRSFVRDITENSNDAAIADAVISMAHSLGMRVLAEGVETEAQCEYLSRNMCDEIQGFLFSEPLPAPEMEALLLEGRGLPGHLLRLHKPARTLLLVDDEPSILSALRRQLRQDGYQILTAADGRAGLDLLEQNKIDVIVSDQRMPGLTGVEFLRKVKTLYPDTVRIVLSGFTELQSVTDAVNEGAIYKFLTKPWDDAQLREHIAEAFQHKEMADENRRLNMQVRTANQELASAHRQLEEVLRHKQL